MTAGVELQPDLVFDLFGYLKVRPNLRRIHHFQQLAGNLEVTTAEAQVQRRAARLWPAGSQAQRNQRRVSSVTNRSNALSLSFLSHLEWGWSQRLCSYDLTTAYISLPHLEWGWSQRLCSYDLTTAYISLSLQVLLAEYAIIWLTFIAINLVAYPARQLPPAAAATPSTW